MCGPRLQQKIIVLKLEMEASEKRLGVSSNFLHLARLEQPRTLSGDNGDGDGVAFLIHGV